MPDWAATAAIWIGGAIAAIPLAVAVALGHTFLVYVLLRTVGVDVTDGSDRSAKSYELTMFAGTLVAAGLVCWLAGVSLLAAPAMSLMYLIVRPTDDLNGALLVWYLLLFLVVGLVVWRR